MDIGRLTTLARSSIATLSSFRHHDLPHHDPDDELFPSFTIIFTLHGQWGFRSQNESAEVDRETVVLGNTGQHYHCYHDALIPNDQNISVGLDHLRLRQVLQRYPPFDSPIAEERIFRRVCIPKTPRLDALLSTLLSEAETRDLGHALKVDVLAMELVVESLRLSESLPSRRPRWQSRHHADQVEAIKTFLKSHLTEEVDLVTLARVAALSPYYLSRVFKAQVGLSLHQYLVQLRIERAAELLRNTSLDVTQICYQVGFSSLSHFVTTFRQHTGVTPSQYRRR